MNTKLKLVGETEVQNYKMPSHLWKEVTDLKNIHMFTYRVSGNLSQDKVARLAGISTQLWMYLENRKMIPTDVEAERVCQLLGKPVFAVFKTTRHNYNMKVRLRSLSKLALYRGIKGIAQVDLARRSGVPLKVIRLIENEWETGADVPDDMWRIVYSLADYLELDIVDIVGRVEGVKRNA